jgi:hypothetical protein
MTMIPRLLFAYQEINSALHPPKENVVPSWTKNSEIQKAAVKQMTDKCIGRIFVRIYPNKSDGSFDSTLFPEQYSEKGFNAVALLLKDITDDKLLFQQVVSGKEHVLDRNKWDDGHWIKYSVLQEIFFVAKHKLS